MFISYTKMLGCINTLDQVNNKQGKQKWSKNGPKV